MSPATDDQGELHWLFLSYPKRINWNKWIDNFVEQLTSRLAANLGDECFSVWYDTLTPGNTDFPEHLYGRVTEAIAFLLIHSRAYYVSPFCRGELDVYLGRRGERGKVGFPLFLIEYERLQRPQPELQTISGYCFWMEHPKKRSAGPSLTLGTLEAKPFGGDELYQLTMVDLCYDLTTYLESRVDVARMREEALPPAVALSLDKWREKKQRLQDEVTRDELREFVGFLQLAVMYSLNKDQPVDFSIALKLYEHEPEKKDALFEALAEWVRNTPD